MIWAWLAAIGIGLSLGLLGSGGSILTVPVLVYVVGQPEKVAIASSLAIVGSISAVAAIPFARSRLVHLPSVLRFGLPAVAGTYAGAWLAKFVPGSAQLLLFAAVMIGAAVFMLLRRDKVAAADGTSEPAPPSRLALILVEGFAVGVITGLVGVGGGFLMVPALVFLGGLSMHQAIGTSLAIIALKSTAGFIKYIDVLGDLGLSLDWQLIGIFTVMGIVGSLIGRRICTKLNQQTLQRAFAGVLLATSAVILGTAM